MPDHLIITGLSRHENLKELSKRKNHTLQLVWPAYHALH